MSWLRRLAFFRDCNNQTTNSSGDHQIASICPYESLEHGMVKELWLILVSASRQIRCSIVVSISACHGEVPGSIPNGGALALLR